MRSFAAADQPAGKYIRVIRALDKAQLVRAIAYMRQLFADIGCGLQLARPLGNGDAPGANAHGRRNVLAAGKPRGGHAARPLEEIMFGSAGDDAARVQHQQVTAKTEGLFHIVCDEDHRACVAG